MYRRNSDENIRVLERNAHNSDIDFIKYAAALSRIGELPPEVTQELRRIWRSEYEATRTARRERSESTHSLLMKDIILLRTDIFQNTVLDYHDRAHQLYLVLRTMLQDMPASSEILDVAGWLYDRKAHRITPGYPQHTNIVEPRLPWFSFDLIDLSSDIYGSGVFPAVSVLRDWHQLTKLTDRAYHDPRIFRQKRPSPQDAINQVIDFFANTFGVEPLFPLRAVHGEDIYDTHFRIYIETAGRDLLIGTLTYKLEDNGFVRFEMRLDHEF